ncbi:MAG: 30S ribosomal protein S20, partial [Clostridia bacterium]|nr:30S ribosomal protein S20 [Clostridia bacterium]
EKAGISGEAVKIALKKLDMAVSKGIIHKNTAARKKAAIIRKCNSVE